MLEAYLWDCRRSLSSVCRGHWCKVATWCQQTTTLPTVLTGWGDELLDSSLERNPRLTQKVEGQIDGSRWGKNQKIKRIFLVTIERIMYVYIYIWRYICRYTYIQGTHTHTLTHDFFRDRHWIWLLSMWQNVLYFIKTFLTQYLSSMISENKGILGNSQHMMVKKLWMTKRGILQGVAVVCLYKVRGVSSFCPLANTKFLKQQDSECTTKSITKLLFKRRNLCVPTGMNSGGNNTKR